MSADLSRTHWTTQDRARHFVIPDEAELSPGDFALRTATGRERSVDEAAVAPFEVTEEEARAWAKEQLGAVFGELRGQTLDFVAKLRQKTAAMREENRRTWEQAVADAPPEVREAGAQLRDMLRDLGATLRRAAREHGYNPDAPAAAELAPSANASAADSAQPADSPATASASAAADAAQPADSQPTAGQSAAASASAAADAAQPPDSQATAGPSAAAGAARPEDSAAPEEFATGATASASVDSAGSAVSGDADAAGASGESTSMETAPVDADRSTTGGGAPNEPPAAERSPSGFGGNATPRVDAPAIRLRPEP